MILNTFATKAAADKAQAYDFTCMQAAHSATMDADAFAKYYSVTTAWAEPRQTIKGDWVYEVCPQSDKKYTTIEYSADLFPVVAGIS
jgi:hypothetical protein